MIHQNKIDFGKVKKVGIDIDDVVVNTASSFLEFYNSKHGTSFVFENIKTYDLDKVVGISPEEARKELDEFFHSECFQKVDLMENAKETIDILAEHFEIVFITSRPLKYKEGTKDHLGYHFGNLDFEIFHSTGSDYEESGSKGEICKDYGVDVMIEDNTKYAKDCAEKGVEVILFDKPWNKDKEEEENIIKFEGWKDILKELNSLEFLSN